MIYHRGSSKSRMCIFKDFWRLPMFRNGIIAALIGSAQIADCLEHSVPYKRTDTKHFSLAIA